MHRWDCPTDYEARRRAERDFEYGSYNRNPYRSTWGDDGCEEAARTYDRAYRDAERRDEERREEEAAAERRAEYRRQEEMYERQRQEEYEQQQYYEEQYTAQQEAEINAQYEAEQAEIAKEQHKASMPSDDEVPF